MSCQIPPRKKTVSLPSSPPAVSQISQLLRKTQIPPIQILRVVCVSGKAGLPLVNHGPGRGSKSYAGGRRKRHLGPLLMSSGSLLSDYSRIGLGSLVTPVPQRGSAPTATCLPTYLLPRVLPALDLSPGALLYPVSGKPGLASSGG